MAENPPRTPDKREETISLPSSNRRPESIGPYKILEALGEGGMGIVYLAEQQTPIRRKVALKIIKLGMDTAQVVARFESERQTLALLSHPNVAKVFDAGTTEQGRPYFVMEHIAGIPITEYCDKHLLDNKQRLELFIHVCEANQHAHQKGIIHRDIKPTNVLVAVQDGRPVPKVIDFGVAKATTQRLTERTLFTEQGILIGTPEYMSPEQAEMTALDIDSRTDIYSLGVLLYELLVGALPFDRDFLRQAAFIEIQRIIRETDPPKPSDRLATMGETASAAAKRRHSDIRSLHRQLRGDLDWITMKALEKDRTRRYASASEFAADIGRYLGDETVLARPANTLYRLRKFAKKYKGSVAAGILLGVTVAASIAGFSYGLAEKSYTQSHKREFQWATFMHVYTRAEIVDDAGFMVGLFDRTDFPPGESNVSAKKILDLGVQRVQQGRFVQGVLPKGTDYGPPENEALRLNLLGQSYLNLGFPDEAEPLIRKALAIREKFLRPSDPNVVQSLETCAELCRRTGRGLEADQFSSRAKALRASWPFPQGIDPDDPRYDDLKQALNRIFDRVER